MICTFKDHGREAWMELDNEAMCALLNRGRQIPRKIRERFKVVSMTWCVNGEYWLVKMERRN